MHVVDYRWGSTGLSETAITITGGPRVNLIFDGRESFYSCIASGILSIRGPEVSLGPLGDGNRRAQAPTPHAPALQAFLTEISQQTKEL